MIRGNKNLNLKILYVNTIKTKKYITLSTIRKTGESGRIEHVLIPANSQKTLKSLSVIIEVIE